MAIIPFIIVQMVAFIALVLVLRKVMISSSFAETKRLQQLNAENLKKARELEEKIEETEKQYKEKIIKAEDEIRKMKDKAQQEVERLREETLARTREEKERLIGQALSAKERLREEIEGTLLDKSLEFSRRIVTEILSAQNQRLVCDAFLETVLQDLEDMEDEAFRDDSLKTAAVVVKASHEMRSQQKERLQKILTAKLGRPPEISWQTDQGLIAGLAVTMGSFMIEGSLAAKFKKAAEVIKHGN